MTRRWFNTPARLANCFALQRRQAQVLGVSQAYLALRQCRIHAMGAKAAAE